MFYSPYDKAGLTFQTVQHAQMLGRSNLPFNYIEEDAIVKVKSFWANSDKDNDFVDVWHVDLMGWYYPGMIYKSRYIDEFNNSNPKNPISVGIAGISLDFYMEVKNNHINPIWSVISDYFLSGNIPNEFPKPPSSPK